MIKFYILYFIIINIIAFLVMGNDKRRSIKKQWRISEKDLISLAVIGGSIGILSGIKVFRHKTKHKLFTIGVPLIFLTQILILSYILY